jgi:hypothetical protein
LLPPPTNEDSCDHAESTLTIQNNLHIFKSED